MGFSTGCLIDRKGRVHVEWARLGKVSLDSVRAL
jgi:hypothetical protein